MYSPAANPIAIAQSLYRYDQPAQHRIPTIQDLTDAHIQQYHQLGYLIVDNLYNESVVKGALQEISDVISGKIVGPRIQYFKNQEEAYNDFQGQSSEQRELYVRKLHKFIEHCPTMKQMCYQPQLIQLLEKLFGDNVIFTNEDQALLKPPSKDAGIEKPWHQDMAYANFAYNRLVAGVWIALDPATKDNGCMHLIPRSHINGPVPHYAVRDWQICDITVEVGKDEIVELKPGGALIFNGLLHHGTPANLSDKRRQALQFHYAPESAVKLSPKEYKLVFTNEITNAEC